MRVLISFLIVGFVPGNAHAHLGHLGEVAGHAHWLALGAGVTAAAIAALMAKKKRDAEQQAEQENTIDSGDVQDDGEQEAAGA